MDIHAATEQAYKKGYEDGKRANWISVKDQLPEPHVDVITYRAKNGYVEVSHRLKSRWWCESESNPITHWMYIPDPPER